MSLSIATQGLYCNRQAAALATLGLYCSGRDVVPLEKVVCSGALIVVPGPSAFLEEC